MEDYTVGSLAELISGQKVDNKRKLVVKKVSSKKPRLTEFSSTNNDNNGGCKNDKSMEKKKKKKGNKEHMSASPNTHLTKNSRSTNYDADHKNRKDKKKKNGKKEHPSEPPEKPVVDKPPGDEQKQVKQIRNAERRIKQKVKALHTNMDSERNSRTIFLGNVPLKIKKQAIKKLCMKYGTVEAVRLRCAPVADPRTPKKVAVIKQEFHPTRTSIHSFVRFASREEAEKALALNGKLYEGHHLRAKLCDEEKPQNEHNAIFVGNIDFGAEEEDLWNTFESVGNILSVRLIRDARTGLGKGFGYVNFESSDSVELALQMEPPVLKNRELRISGCNTNLSNKFKKKKDKESNPERKQFVNKSGDGNKTKAKSFEGSKFTDKKKRKKKVSKEVLKKKNLIRQLVKTSN